MADRVRSGKRRLLAVAASAVLVASVVSFIFYNRLNEAPSVGIISVTDEDGKRTEEGGVTNQRVQHIVGAARDPKPDTAEFDGRVYLYFNGLDEEVPVYNDGTHGDTRALDETWSFDAVRVLGNGTNTFGVKVRSSTGTTVWRSKDFSITAEVPTVDVWIQLVWNSSERNLNLSISDPTGAYAGRQNRDGIAEGQLSVHDQDGYGPQVFTLVKTKPGNYSVKVSWLRSQDQSGVTKAVVRMLTSWGVHSAYTHVFMPGVDDSARKEEWLVTTLSDGSSLPDEDSVMFPKVLLIIFNPVIESQGGRKLSEVKDWNDPDELTRQVIEDLKEVSHGSVQFRVVERVEVDEYPVKRDGFRYTDETYLSEQWHTPHEVDYRRIIDDYSICEKVEGGQIDEVWLWGGPYFGYYESTMVGIDAYWVNSPPVSGVNCSRLFIIMGFNYERGVGEMLEDFGHRTESIMMHVFGGWEVNEENAWNKFTLYDKVAPGRANCGNVHYAPNSESDYDWGNSTYVDSYCDDWYTYPYLPGNKKRMNAAEWGYGDIRLHHKWWFKHLPHVAGEVDGHLNNWWKYVIMYNKYRR